MENFISFSLLRTGTEEYLNYDILQKKSKKGLILNEVYNQIFIITELNELLKTHTYEKSLNIISNNIKTNDFETVMHILGFKNILNNESEKNYYKNYYHLFLKNSS